MQFNTIRIEEGIKLHKINTKKFKTNLLAINLTTKHDRTNITKNALILSILKRGTSTLKTQEAINIKLEELYGAEFNCGIDKLGNDSIFKFYIESLNDNFTYKKENVLRESVNTLFEIIFNPLIENDRFNEEYFNSEKENLRQIIRARKDNKGLYAYTRCIEEMYKEEPYGLYTYGYEEDLDKITNEDLYKTYLENLKNCKIDIFVSGEFSETSKIDQIVIDNIKKELTIYSDYTIENSDSFIVNLKALEDEMLLIDLKVSVPTKNQAKSLCSKWKENPSEIYNKLMQSLFSDEN